MVNSPLLKGRSETDDTFTLSHDINAKAQQGNNTVSQKDEYLEILQYISFKTYLFELHFSMCY